MAATSCTQRLVVRCFKTLERWGDKITGAAGPWFVGLALVLISLGVVSFFAILAPLLPLPLITLPICLLLAVNTYAHYWWACTVPPGFVTHSPKESGRGWFWATRRPARWGQPRLKLTKGPDTKCRKCLIQRPERAHHCRICKQCVLKYDHHCPVWINQCVGINNERHFVLFMVYLVLCCLSFTVIGYATFLESLGFNDGPVQPWPYPVPQLPFILTYLLAPILGLSVAVLLGYHLNGVSRAETAVEVADFRYYRKVAGQRGEEFGNCFDLGRKRNLELFFNVGPEGYPLYTLLLPLRTLPYTEGRAWARNYNTARSHSDDNRSSGARGEESEQEIEVVMGVGHRGVRRGEELTDEEDEDDSEV